MIKYAVTNQSMECEDQKTWKLNEVVEYKNPNLFHVYYHCPEMANLVCPNVQGIVNPRIFRADCGEGSHKNILYGRTNEMTLLVEIVPTEYTISQRVAFAILCAKMVYFDIYWDLWADRWLENIDRSRRSAQAISYRLTVPINKEKMHSMHAVLAAEWATRAAWGAAEETISESIVARYVARDVAYAVHHVAAASLSHMKDHIENTTKHILIY